MLASNKSIIFHVGHLYSQPPPNLLGLPLRPTPNSYPRSATPVEKFISADLFNSFSHIFFLYKISFIFSKSKKSSKKGLFSPETKKSSTFPAADNKKGLAFFFLLISKVHRYKIWTHVYYWPLPSHPHILPHYALCPIICDNHTCSMVQHRHVFWFFVDWHLNSTHAVFV